MQILPLLLGLWQSLSNFELMLGTLFIPFLLMSASSLITISTFSCKILRLLMNLCAVFLTKAKKLLSKQKQCKPEQLKKVESLEQELQRLKAALKLSEEVISDEQKRVFKIQR